MTHAESLHPPLLTLRLGPPSRLGERNVDFARVEFDWLVLQEISSWHHPNFSKLRSNTPEFNPKILGRSDNFRAPSFLHFSPF